MVNDMTNNEAPFLASLLSGEDGVPIDFTALPVTVVTEEPSIRPQNGIAAPYLDNGSGTANQTENMAMLPDDEAGDEPAVALNEGDVFDLASLGHTLFITGDDSPDAGQDLLVLSDAWNSGGTVTEGGVTFHSYMATVAGQTVTLNVEQGLGIALNQQDG